MNRILLAAVLILVTTSVVLLSKVANQKQINSSILIIAVEELGPSEVNCPEEPDTDGFSGFQIMCAESIRFTHAYTPSILSGPALASLLTGLYPADHGLRHHDVSALSNKAQTLGQQAQKLKMRTSFISGGAPILRKLGLHKGFDTFEDQFPLHPQKIFRSIEDSNKLFLRWLDEDKQNFFSVLYSSDLLFPQIPTYNMLGEKRSLGFESQLAEIDESLYELITELKRRNLWNSSYVVLLGLNGSRQFHRPTLPPNINLLSDRSQVSLLIKPPKPERDSKTLWRVDEHVTLADMGKTFFEILQKKSENSSNLNQFSVISTLPHIQNPNQTTNPSRMLLIESAWPLQLGFDQIRFSIRSKNLIYVHDKKPQLYNSLMDRLETSMITNLESPYVEFVDNATAALHLQSPFDLEGFENFLFTDEPQLQMKKNRQIRNSIRTQGLYSTLQSLDENERLNITQHPCWILLENPQIDSQLIRNCDDPLARDVAELLAAQIQEESDIAEKRKRLQRSNFFYQVDLQVANQHLETDQTWSINDTLSMQIPIGEWIINRADIRKLIP